MLPREFNRYYEPFLGGGAMMLHTRPATAKCGDLNGQLVNCYWQIRFAPVSVLHHLREFGVYIPCEEYYLEQRARYNTLMLGGEMSPLTAALMIWLNSQCFNGIYRVNRAGAFNVPYNKKQRRTHINEENIFRISDYLNRGDIRIKERDFYETCRDAARNDFVFFDPPYVPVNGESSCKLYTRERFSDDEQKRLAALFRDLDSKGVKLMLTDHDTPLTRELYGRYPIRKVNVRRSVNSDPKGRTGREIIVTNYEPL